MGVEVRSTVALKDVLRKVETGWSPVCDSARPAMDEWGVLKLSAVTSGKFVASEAKRLPSEVLPRIAFEVRPGDVLMSRANGVKALVGVACTVHQVRPRLLLPDLVFRLVADPELLDPGFLGIALTSAPVRRQMEAAMRGTSGQYKVSQADVRALEIPHLPLPEQRDIVAAHEAFERRIGALERELDKLRTVEDAVVAGTMAESGGRIELGRWLSSIEAGKSPMAEDTPAGDGEWGVLKVSAVQPGWFKAIENKVVREVEFINARYRVSAGDLLMTRANTEELVGLACVIRERTERLMLSDKTLRLVPDTGVAEAEFIELALLSPSVRSQVRSRATGTSASMKNIGQSAVRQLMVPDVPKDMQRKVVAAVSASRKRSQGVQRQIAKLRQVQRGVIEELLSGRTRVNRT
jgi:type I restriction enzyme S subunit